MTAVFKNSEDLVVIDRAWIERVKEHARSEPLRRARLNLHRSDDDQVQEMLLACCKDSLITPHRHVGKSESMHAFEGRAHIVFFDDSGTVTRRITIGGPETGLPGWYRLAAPDWHAVIPLDEMLVVHETITGPFRPQGDDRPTWLPATQPELRRFIESLAPGSVAPC